MHKLEKLGPKICIIGPSCSGKSTLANRLASQINSHAYHLDQLAHKENTNWERRPEDVFIKDHNEIINLNTWVIDGNYSICMPQRFKESTSVIWLEPTFIGFLWRYTKRSFKKDPSREGILRGAPNEYNPQLIKFNFLNYPENKIKYKKLLQSYKKPLICISSMKELNKYYDFWHVKF